MDSLFTKGKKTFGKYKSVKHVEVEMRLGKVYRGGFDTDVGKLKFYRILKALEKFNGWENVEESDTSVYYSKGVRTAFDNVTNDHVSTIEKTRVDCFDTKFEDSPYDVRFCVSTEKPVVTEDCDEAEMVRSKKRKSFIRNNLRIDMTIVKGGSDDMDDESEERYEVELEIINVDKVISDVNLYNIMYKAVCVMNCCSEAD